MLFGLFKKSRKNHHAPKTSINFNEILRPKTPLSKQIINPPVTVTTQLLLQANNDAYEARELGIKSGLIQEGMRDSEAIACPLAYYVFSGFEEKVTPYWVGTFLLTYCKIEIIDEFIHFYSQFAKIEKEKFTENLKNSKHETIMDIKALAKMATKLKLKKSTPSPFREPYNQIWINNFS